MMQDSTAVKFFVCFIILFINFIYIHCYIVEPILMINKAGTENYNNKPAINHFEHTGKIPVTGVSLFWFPNRNKEVLPETQLCPNGGRWIMGQCAKRWMLQMKYERNSMLLT
ncbi:uncharacterized protein LOC142324445 [Lycorma delicatula]|uniref:uncharacterized protein LOC142324445 n=1 Tax=Lycorma delicatula TaxID=130591 RepID=UPI003F513A05